jgi:GDP-L-fucose synthase
MTIAVVGATGLVGRHVVEAFERAGGHRVVATWHSRPPFEVGNTDWVHCDLRDPSAARRALQGTDAAVLCAGQLSTSAVLRRDPMGSVLDTLRIGTNVLEAAARARLSRVVLISSCTGYPELARPAIEEDMSHGEPPTQWFGVGWMHRYLERQLCWYAEHLGLIDSAVILRPTLVYGPYDDFSTETGHFVPTLVRMVVERTSPLVVWGDGKQKRNLLHASDLAAAILTVVHRRTAGVESFNVGSPQSSSINEVLRHLLEIDGFSDAVVTHDHTRHVATAEMEVSSAALAEATGWAAQKTMRQGLADTIQWYRQS